ncbi:MAG: Type pilus assembly protein PilM [Verrucomicrobiales bacterium]|nr:Type pilus assembly protein PilM [Verrucomicrobiales bacterium]
MGLPFLSQQARKKDQVVAIDLGNRVTKAVYLQKKGEKDSLARYVLQEAPVYEKGFSADVLTDHLKLVSQSLDARTRQVTISLGVQDSILRNTEMPIVPVSDMRQMLKFNTKNYLQQDLPDYAFDCFVMAPREGRPDAPRATKFKVWVGGAKNNFINEVQRAVKNAGLLPDMVTLGLLGPANAFEVALPDVFKKEVVALVDIGFRNSTISIICEGELMLSRVVGIGGDKLTTGLAESLGTSYAEAEGIKIGMPQEVESSLQPLLSPLGRELRASIDFFEHQNDRAVSQIYMSGAAARSEFMIQTLQTEMMVPAKMFNPVESFDKSLSPQQMAEVEQVGPQLTVAVGAAISTF